MQSSFTPSPDERQLIALFRSVLQNKRNEGGPGWRLLCAKFAKWDHARQLRWIYWIEEQAQGPNPTKLAETLMTAVTVERLKG